MRIDARSLTVVLSALALTMGCSSAGTAAGGVRGTYEAEAGGPFLWIDFADATHYELLRSGGCSLAPGAGSACQARGTYAFDAQQTTLTLADDSTHAKTSFPFHVEAFANRTVATDALHLSGGNLSAGDSGALASSSGGLVSSLGLADAISVDGALMRLLDGSTSLIVTDASALIADGPSGYLVASAGSAVSPTVLCGATLIRSNVVITAAHCATKAAAGSTWSFGVGEVGGALYAVTGNLFHDHPAYVDVNTPNAGIGAKLRENDLAYLVLEKPVPGVTPAAIGPQLSRDCPGGSEGMVTYRPARQSGTACVELALTLPAKSPDAIYEVHPLGSSICPADGDDGSPLYAGDRLAGIFVGSVVGAIMDCTSYLNGYESLVGHQDFVSAAIAAGG